MSSSVASLNDGEGLAGLAVGVLGAAAAFLSASAITGAPDASGRRFLFSAGLLTVALCIDDAFLLHDEVLVADRSVSHGQLKDSVEHHPTAT